MLNQATQNNLLTHAVPVWYNSGVMKYDYTVQTIYGVTETCSTLGEAKSVALRLLKERPDCDPVIDQYYKDDELTGEYWTVKKGKLVKALPPISLKGFIR